MSPLKAGGGGVDASGVTRRRGAPGPSRPAPRAGRRGGLRLALAALLAAAVALPTPVGAAFTATTTSATGGAAAAAGFPTFPTLVGQDTPDLYHPGEDAASAATAPAVADAAAGNHPGTLTGASTGPTTWWRFNGDTTFAADSSGAVGSGTLKGTAALSGSGGRSGGGLVLDGSGGGYLEGAKGVLDTTRSFTAAVWVNLAATGTSSRAALALEGTAQSAFGLMYRDTTLCNCWELRLTGGDTAGATNTSVRSATGSAVPGTWTHLAVVYDASTGKDSFYVNGTLQGTATAWTAWKATGSLVAGRQTGGGGPVNYWNGGLDEAVTYQRAFSAADVGALYALTPSLRWDFDEQKGTATRDLSGNGAAGTFGSGAGWYVTGRSVGGVTLDGTANGYVSTTASPVDTTASFTVSAAVRVPPGATASGSTYTILSQQGSATSGFVLKYADIGGGTFRWVFAMARSDVVIPVMDQTTSTTAPALGTWVLLTAVHDAAARTLALYVDGTAVGTVATHTSTFAAVGGLQAGRSWEDNAWKYPFLGLLDQVSTYQRALTAAEVSSLATTEVPRFTAAVPGALTGPEQGLSARTATAFAGVEGGYNGFRINNPTTFTLECWFRTTTTTGGQIVGFASNPTGMLGGSIDRMVFMTDDGRLTFALAGNAQPRSPVGTPYNDGAWHHVAATFTSTPATGTPAATMYVDGAAVASSAVGTVVTPGNYNAYLRWGAAQVRNWSTDPTTSAFLGSIDEVAVYPTVLSARRVAEHAFANY